MKKLRDIFIMLVISLAVGYGVYSFNANAIKTSTTDMAGEIGVIAVPVFILLLFLYMVARLLGKAVKKKKPSA